MTCAAPAREVQILGRTLKHGNYFDNRSFNLSDCRPKANQLVVTIASKLG